MSEPDFALGDPLLRKLFDYWSEKKGTRLAPTRADIDPGEIRALLPNVLLVERIGDPTRYRDRLVGTDVVKVFGEEITGKFLDEVDFDDVTSRVVSEYDRVATECRPIASKWSYKKLSGRYVEYERLILPLSSDGQTVDMFLCGATGAGAG
jgi:hypothetical protein